MIEDAVAMADDAAPCLAVVADLSPQQIAAAKALLRGAVLRWNDVGSGAMAAQAAGPFSQSVDTGRYGGRCSGRRKSLRCRMSARVWWRSRVRSQWIRLLRMLVWCADVHGWHGGWSGSQGGWAWNDNGQFIPYNNG